MFKAFRRFSSLLGKVAMELVVGKMPVVRRWGGWFLVEMSASSSNSVGVAIPQPRVAGAARYPGYTPPLI